MNTQLLSFPPLVRARMKFSQRWIATLALETSATVAFPWDRHVLNDAGEIITNPLYEDMP
jgi:hypothetical protein